MSMPALGQKQTSRHVRVMSPSPPKADIGTQPRDVRFVPKADIGRPLLDDHQQRVEDDQSGLSSLTQIALGPSQVLKQTGCSNRVGFAQSEFGLQVR